MNIRKTLLFAAIISVTLFACSKSSSSSASAQAMLTTNRWQMSDATVTIPGTSITVDVYDSIPACIKDNFYTFATDGTATIDEGATKCDDTSPQTVSGNWKLLNNNTQLQTIDPLSQQEATLTVASISSSTLRLQDTATYNYMGSNIKVNATVTLTNVK